MTKQELEKINILEKEIKRLEERLDILNFKNYPLYSEREKIYIDKSTFTIRFKIYCKNSEFKYPEINIPLSREQLEFLFQQHKNQIMAELYHTKTKFEKIKINNL